MSSRGGSIRDVRHVLNIDPREEDEDAYDDDDEEYEQSLEELRRHPDGDDSDPYAEDDGYADGYDTSRAVVGTMERPKLSGLVMNLDATHSTMQIKVRGPSSE